MSTGPWCGPHLRATSSRYASMADRAAGIEAVALRTALAVLRFVPPPFIRSPKEGAIATVHLASAPTSEGVTGQYFIDRGHSRSQRLNEVRSAREFGGLRAKTTVR
jgi:hypothetical protein